MQRVESHIVINNKQIDKLCFLSKNLYNYCNYILRHIHFNKIDQFPLQLKSLLKEFSINEKTYKTISQYDLINYLCKTNQADYRALPAQSSQQTILLLYNNWKSFFKSLNTPNCKPKIPKYKHKKNGRNIIVFTNQQCKIKNNFLHFPKKVNLNSIKTKLQKFNQVRISPQATCYVIEIIYDKNVIDTELDHNLYLSIDLGINNLATCINNVGNKPFIINGKVLKSMNQFYNKEKAKLQSYIGGKGTSNRIINLTFKRNQKINDYLHKTSRYIVDYCITNKIKNIVIGYNQQWKRGVHIGKVNNQKFVLIPYLKLINQIRYKSEEVGMSVIENEESYTSKCDSLVLEAIGHHESYLGERRNRGLFRSTVGLINADVNGVINILRKVIGDDFVSLLDRGLVCSPSTVNVLKKFNSF